MACNSVSAVATSNNSSTQLSSNSSTYNSSSTVSTTNSSSKVVISGKVLKCSDGTPFSGVTVTVSKGETKLASTTTGNDGTYTLSFLSNDMVFNVTASYPGHIPSSKSVTVTSGAGSTIYGTADFKLGIQYAHVSPTGDDSNDGSYGSPFRTIQKALTEVNSGGWIYLMPGTYSGTGNVNLLIDKSVNIYGTNGAYNTIINGGGSWIFHCYSPNLNDHITVNINGITLKNGNSDNGGAIYSYPYTCWVNLNIENCVFTDNSATKGGAIYCEGRSNVNVRGCTFENNYATTGGAIYATCDKLTVVNCRFQNNHADTVNTNGDGGAIYNGKPLTGEGDTTVTNCNFITNTAQSGTIYNHYDGILTVTGSTFTGNTATGGGGAIETYGKSCTVNNCTFTGNTALMGGAICIRTNASINCSTFTGNTVTGGYGGAIYNSGDSSSTIHFCRILNNNGTDVYSSANVVDATKNWWGNNFQGTNPQSANRVNSNVNANPWVILTIKASPAKIDKGGTSTITADFNHINGGGDLTGGHIPDGPITLNVPWGSLNSNGYSLSEDTVNGVISPVTFYANGVTVNPSYNPVKVTASADSYTTNTESAFITINGKANLSITKTGPSNVTAGNQITYTITVTNNGPDYASDVIIKDIFPAGISNVRWTAVFSNGTIISGTGDITLNIATFQMGDSCTITVNGTVLSSTTNGTTISNTATVNASTTETDPLDNSATASTTVNTQSTLNVVKEALNQVTAGATYTDPIYRITVANNGPSDARDVQVTDSIPNQIVNREYRIDGGAWTSFTGDLNQLISYIASGSSNVIEIRGKILSSALAGPISNNASASVYGNTFNSTPVITNIVTSAGIELNETVNNSRPNVGDTVTFTVTARNNGPSDTLNIRIHDLMPSNFINVTVTPSKGTYNNGIWTLDLTSGETATLNLTGVVSSVMAGKNTTNTASYGSNSTSATIYVPKSDLYIKITTSNTNPKVSEKFLLTYKLGNKGPDAAENVTITFQIPEGLDFVNISVDNGKCTYNETTRTVTWTLDSVPVGDPYLYLTVKAADDGTYKITPNIASTTYNLNSGDSGTITINVQPNNNENTVNAASKTTIGLQKTGLPLNYLLLAVLMVLSGLIPKRK